MTDTVVAEGHVKFRDGKKWKSRWVVLRKPSPVADCLSLLVYKEKKKGKEKGSGLKERLCVTLEGICGVEPGLGYDGVSYTFSILCLAHTLVLGFNSREALMAWDARVRYSLGEVHRFSVNIEPGTKLEIGPASLHLCNDILVLTRGVPPGVIGHWKLSSLRRYGAVPQGFVFEGGTRCGCWAGVFFLSCSEGEQISFLFDCIVRGITPSRAPHGLQPALPDPNADPLSVEKRINQEASELEKRLSMLSQCSLASSTASSSSCSTSVAGDDQTSISSSSSNQSDKSYGSRVPFWVEPSSRSHISNESLAGSSTLKALASSDDRLYAAVTGNPRTSLSSAQLHPRGLSDSGRQTSLDSGIGIATGSQSSYSGSFSSCTESLDSQGRGRGEEFGSAASLLAPPSSPLSVPPSSPPPPPLQYTLLFNPNHQEHSSSTSAACTPCASRSSSSASQRHSEDYQIPSQFRLRYDTPRSLFPIPCTSEPSLRGGPPGLGRDSRSSADGGGSQGQRSSKGPKVSGTQCLPMMQLSHTRGSEKLPSGDAEIGSTGRQLQVPEGSVCEETQYTHGVENYITPEQWWSVRSRCMTQVAFSPSPSIETPEKRLTSTSPPLPAALSVLRLTSDCATFQSPHPSASLDADLHSHMAVNYVNIPSLMPARANRGLHLELDLQGSCPEDDPNRCARLHATAMQTKQRVGSEDTLTSLENRRRGAPK